MKEGLMTKPEEQIIRSCRQRQTMVAAFLKILKAHEKQKQGSDEPPNKRMKDDTDSNDGMAGPSGSQNNQIPPPFGMNRMPMPPGNMPYGMPPMPPMGPPGPMGPGPMMGPWVLWGQWDLCHQWDLWGQWACHPCQECHHALIICRMVPQSQCRGLIP